MGAVVNVYVRNTSVGNIAERATSGGLRGAPLPPAGGVGCWNAMRLDDIFRHAIVAIDAASAENRKALCDPAFSYRNDATNGAYRNEMLIAFPMYPIASARRVGGARLATIVDVATGPSASPTPWSIRIGISHQGLSANMYDRLPSATIIVPATATRFGPSVYTHCPPNGRISNPTKPNAPTISGR